MNDIQNKIDELQASIAKQREEVVALRKELPLEEIKDYNFKDRQGNDVTLSSLFGDSDELLIIHNMGKQCKYCTMWADGFRGFSEIISDRMPFVLTSPNEYEVLDEFASSRSWNFPCISYADTNFALDLGFEHHKDGKKYYSPGASALIKKGGSILRTSYDFFGPGDYYNSAWHFFDLFPKGADGWHPKYEY